MSDITLAICARSLPLLKTILSEKFYYVDKVLKVAPKSDKNDFLIQKNEEHIEELQTLICLISLQFPDCGEVLTKEDENILKYLKENPKIKEKLKEKIDGIATPQIK